MCTIDATIRPASADLLGSDDSQPPGWMKACASERHIGIDQGIKNFAMVAVDKNVGSVPRIVGAGLYDLRRSGVSKERINVNTLILALSDETALFSWKQKPGQPSSVPTAQRIIVHVEQLSVKNKFGKKLGMELARVTRHFSNTELMMKCSSLKTFVKNIQPIRIRINYIFNAVKIGLISNNVGGQNFLL